MGSSRLRVWSSSSRLYGSHLQVGLLAALDELVKGGSAEVSVNVCGIQPLQSLHNDLLQHKRTQHTFGSSHTELIDIIHTWRQRQKEQGKYSKEVELGVKTGNEKAKAGSTEKK